MSGLARGLVIGGASLFVAFLFCPVTVEAASGAGKSDEADIPSRLLVTAREYELSLSRRRIEAGQAIVQLYGFGEDPHDLVLQRVGGTRAFGTGEVLPGETGELRFRSKRASTYQLWCSLADHRSLGMEATLRTSKR